jgi:hypothetical protein
MCVNQTLSSGTMRGVPDEAGINLCIQCPESPRNQIDDLTSQAPRPAVRSHYISTDLDTFDQVYSLGNASEQMGLR